MRHGNQQLYTWIALDTCPPIGGSIVASDVLDVLEDVKEHIELPSRVEVYIEDDCAREPQTYFVGT